MSTESETEKKKPFATTKPRSEWRRTKRRVRGRVVEEVNVGAGKDGEAKYDLFVFELTSAGLTVRRKRQRRSGAKVWTFQSLANGVAPGGQMKLL